MGIITKGMGAIMKGAKKRKILTISGSPKPKHRTVIIKKPSKTKLADTWQGRRIDAINRKIGAGKWLSPKRHSRRIKQHDFYIDEASDIYKSKALTKKQYKTNQKQMYSLPEKERYKVWKIQGRRKRKGNNASEIIKILP